MGLLATAVSYGPPVLRDKYSGATIVPEAITAIEDQRSIIEVVPGEGNVNGGWVFNGTVMHFAISLVGQLRGCISLPLQAGRR